MLLFEECDHQNRWVGSAESYLMFSSKVPYFLHTSETLVNSAKPKSNEVICDLGCGSNTFILELLEGIEPRGIEVHCIDQSSEMLNEHRKRTGNFKFPIEYWEAPASEVGTLHASKFDLVIANSCIWQFGSDFSLSSIVNSLNPKGRLAFNLAEWELNLREIANEQRYSIIDDVLAKHGLSPKPVKGNQSRLEVSQVLLFLESAGFSKVSYQVHNAVMTLDNWIDFYSILAVAKKSLPHLDAHTATTILKEALKIQYATGCIAESVMWANFLCIK